MSVGWRLPGSGLGVGGFYLRLLKLEKGAFIWACVLASSTIVFDGLGISLIIVLLDGISGATGAGHSTFSGMPLFGSVAAAFTALDSASRLRTVAVLLGGLAVVRGVVSYTRAMAQRRFEARLDRTIRAKVFDRIMTGALGDVGQEEASWHYNLLTSFASQTSAALGRAVSVVSSAIIIAVVIAYVSVVSLQLTLCALLLLSLVMLVAQRRILPRSQAAGEAVNRFYIDYAQYAIDSIYGLLLIRMFGREKPRKRAFGALLDRQYELGLRAQRWTSLPEPVYSAAVMVTVAALMFIGSHVITDDALLIPSLITFIMILSRLIAPVGGMNEAASYIALQSNGVRVIGEYLEAPQGRAITEGTEVFPGMRTEIALRDVTFSYAANRGRVLAGISMRISRGEFVALVGPSGGGKTTIVRLLARLIDPVEGAVEVDGVDLRHYTAFSWRQRIAVVPQDNFLFNDTVAANLRFARPDATDAELIAAAKAAHAHDFILAQPKGYETVVGDRGSLFSGGQQQRLAIARALLSDPEVIILDEATSNLDAESEAEIKRAISELSGRRTIIVVAHRLSTIRAADRIFVIQNGIVAEEGSYEGLVQQRGAFGRLAASDAAL